MDVKVVHSCSEVVPIAFFRRLWRGGRHGFLWVNPGRSSFWMDVAKLPERIKPIAKNLYFGVHPTTSIPNLNKRGCTVEPRFVRSQLEYVAAVNCMFGDFDAKNLEDGKPEILRKVRTLSPSIILDSGGGYHAYWLLKNTFEIKNDVSRDYIAKLQYRWADYVGADGGAKDLCRVLRVPGSVNYKPEYAPNFPTVSTVFCDFSIEYTVAEICAQLPPLPPEPKPRPRAIRTTGTNEWDRAVATATRMVDRAPDGSKHHELLKASRLLGGYVGGGKGSEHEARNALRLAIEQKPGVRDLNSAYKTIDDGIEYGKGAPL